jgi:hypothetical protein
MVFGVTLTADVGDYYTLWREIDEKCSPVCAFSMGVLNAVAVKL